MNIKRRDYDLIVSLGETCSCSMVLRYLNLQVQSYPLDWSGAWNSNIAGTCGFLGKIQLIENHFKDAFNREDFFETNDAIASQHRFIKNSKTGLQYVHEFPWDVSVDDHFPIFIEKYERRVKRFYNNIENSNKVLFVFIARWGGVLSPDDIFLGCERLCKVFPSTEIDFLIFQRMDNLGVFDTRRLQLSSNINYIFYNDTPTTKDKNIGNLVILRKEIMRYLGYQFIDFTTDYPLSIGLSSPEENGQWSDGKSCLISLKLENFIQGDAKLEFNIEPYVNNKHNLLKVNIYSIFNGRIDKITTWVFEHNKDYNTKFTISSDITKQGQCDLLFKFDSPCIPCEWSGDLRKLGIFFKSIKISSCQ